MTFVPLVNFISFGYLMEYVLRLNRTRNWDLPEWRDFSPMELFSSGCKFFGLLLGYVGIPLLTGWALSELLGLMTFGLLGVVAYVPLGMGAFVGTFLFVAAVNGYANDGLYADAWRLRDVSASAGKTWQGLLFPILAFWGLCVLALPLYGFAFFLGAWILLTFSTDLFARIEGETHSTT